MWNSHATSAFSKHEWVNPDIVVPNFLPQKKTIKKELAAGAGHEAICITKELIVFKDLPEQRKLKEPKNQLTESCKFVNLWKS